ncbi:MAG: cupin domain-containing protein [Actinomycetes bacterium]
MSSSKAFAVNVADAPAYWSLGELLTIVATAEQTGGAFSLMEERLPRGAEPPPHVHSREDEAFFLLEGALTVRVDPGGALRGRGAPGLAATGQALACRP